MIEKKTKKSGGGGRGEAEDAVFLSREALTGCCHYMGGVKNNADEVKRGVVKRLLPSHEELEGAVEE